MLTKMHSLAKIAFVRDVMTMQIGRFLATGCSFLSSILFARYLGLDGFGQYAVALAFTGTMGIFTNLGQQATFLTFFSESYGRKDREAMRIVSHYYVSICCIAAFVLIGFTFASPTITNWLYGDPNIGKLGGLVFISSLFEFQFSYVAIVLQVTREIRLLTIVENAKIVLQLGLSVLLLVLGHDVAGVLIGSILGAAVFACVACILYPSLRKKYDLPSFKEMMKPADTKQLWQHWRDGFWIALDKNIGNLYPTIFLFVLSTTASQAVVGLLRLAFKLGNLPASLTLNSVSRLASSVLPTIAGQGVEAFRNVIRKLVSHSLVLLGVASIGAMICVPIFLPLVYGENFKVAVYPFFVIVILHLTQALHTFTTPILRMKSKIYIASIFNVSSMAASMVTFFTINMLLQKPTWALYAALAVYHLTLTTIIFPTMRLLKHNEPSPSVP